MMKQHSSYLGATFVGSSEKNLEEVSLEMEGSLYLLYTRRALLSLLSTWSRERFKGAGEKVVEGLASLPPFSFLEVFQGDIESLVSLLKLCAFESFNNGFFPQGELHFHYVKYLSTIFISPSSMFLIYPPISSRRSSTTKCICHRQRECTR